MSDYFYSLEMLILKNMFPLSYELLEKLENEENP